MTAGVRNGSAEGGAVAKQWRGGEVRRWKGAGGGLERDLCEKYLRQVQVSRLSAPSPSPCDITPSEYHLLQFHLEHQMHRIWSGGGRAVSLKQVISPRHISTTVRAGEGFVILNFSTKFCSCRLVNRMTCSSV